MKFTLLLYFQCFMPEIRLEILLKGEISARLGRKKMMKKVKEAK